ncbi:MAG: DUF1990 family protein [Solirubrobacterales bacterium]|nr:DUF1990 family protein [Solirubrobacterales bacterium]
MPRRPSAARRWLTALTWPVGVTLTAWDYMWRSTPMHRAEVAAAAGGDDLPPPYPEGVDDGEVQPAQSGQGPLFHRRYRTRIRESGLTAPGLMRKLAIDLNQAAPTAFARFQKVYGDSGRLGVGDEYVVRMPGPWDGPVRVVAVDEASFRLATLAGHLEAGQIEFRALSTDPMVFEIESWARSADRLADLLYHRAHMAKEIQLHMWISFLEGVTRLSGGRMTGGIEIDTRRIDDPFPA